MKSWIAALLALMLVIAPCALAEDVLTEGYEVQDNVLTIRLWDSLDTGCEWSYEIEDEGVLTCTEAMFTCIESSEPAPNVYGWRFAPSKDGETLLTFLYENEAELDAEVRLMCYTVTVEGGQITYVLEEDLSENSEFTGDDGAVVPYEGETGGVELSIQEGMVESVTDEGVLLTSDDGTMTILIDYQKDDDPAELFEQLKDVESASEVYGDEDSDISVIASNVEPDGDVLCATLVLSTPTGITVYTGYEAPEGGVLHVHTTYLLEAGFGEEGEDFALEDEFDIEDEDVVELDGELI